MREKLLAWYDVAARDLPWRQTSDPYAIWVSEVMLQQTRVHTVIPYYERFLARFPTPTTLAEADEDEVLSLWSGLGYYRRARLLYRGVREVVADYGGKVPEEASARRSLPGIGRYTSGAIGSIAFDKEEPIVDGNVGRVLSRLHRIQTPLGSAETDRRLWSEAERLVRGPRPGALNQALMELGATVCTPKQPKCLLCPVRDHCQAFALDEVEALPIPRRKTTPRAMAYTAVVATTGRGAGRRVWLVRGESNLFGGLWGFPMLAHDRPGDGDPGRVLRSVGLSARLRTEAVSTIDHILSHRRLRVDVYVAKAARGQVTDGRRSFVRGDLDSVGISSLTKKILEATDTC